MGVLDMGQQFAAFAHEVQSPAQQVASRSHLGRVDVGHGHHACSEKTRDPTRIDPVVLGFPSMDGSHVQGMAQDEGDLLSLAEVGKPVPGEDALDADGQTLPEGPHCP